MDNDDNQPRSWKEIFRIRPLVEYVSKETSGKKYLWLICNHGMGASVRMYEPVNKVTQKYGISTKVYASGLDEIVYANNEHKKQLLQDCIDHINNGGLIVCMYDTTQELLMALLKHFFPESEQNIQNNVLFLNGMGIFRQSEQADLEKHLQ